MFFFYLIGMAITIGIMCSVDNKKLFDQEFNGRDTALMIAIWPFVIGLYLGKTLKTLEIIKNNSNKRY